MSFERLCGGEYTRSSGIWMSTWWLLFYPRRFCFLLVELHFLLVARRLPRAAAGQSFNILHSSVEMKMDVWGFWEPVSTSALKKKRQKKYIHSHIISFYLYKKQFTASHSNWALFLWDFCWIAWSECVYSFTGMSSPRGRQLLYLCMSRASALFHSSLHTQTEKAFLHPLLKAFFF